jgi:Ni/Co efflux regulator RcnB
MIDKIRIPDTVTELSEVIETMIDKINEVVDYSNVSEYMRNCKDRKAKSCDTFSKNKREEMTFEEAIKCFKKGMLIKRERWSHSNYISKEYLEKASRLVDYKLQFSLEDLVANDWMVK